MTARTDAFNAIIRTALDQRTLTIPELMERVDTDVSSRTVRRALKEAEEYGWVTKQGIDGNSWMSGDIAMSYQISDRVDGYPSDDFPIMYFVAANKVPQSFLNGENVLVSAGVAWRESGTGFSIGIPDANHLMVDSGGYQAATYFQEEYPYTPKQLHEWADSVRADVVWGMDWACEDASILSSNSGIDESEIPHWKTRFERAWDDQVRQFEHYQQGRYDHEFRPVVQGHDPTDFREFAEKLRDSHLPHERVGIGTVCKRADLDTIYKVVSEVSDILPDTDIHLFGATLRVWKDGRFDGLFESSDSAAWLQHDPQSDSRYPDDKERAFRNYKQKAEKSALGQRKA